MDITVNVQRYIDFDKEVTTSPDATINEIVKVIKEKKVEIFPAFRAKMIWSWNKTSPRLKTEALLCLQMFRNYLTSIFETTDVDYNSLYNIKKRIVCCSINESIFHVTIKK